MKGKFTTKTIIIAIIALLVLGIAVTGTVVFLKDSGEAAAAGEQETNITEQGKENEEHRDDDTTKEDNEKLPDLGEEDEETDGDVENDEQNSENDTNTATNNNDGTNDEQTSEEPEPTTIEREKVVAETTTLGWRNIGLNSVVGASNLSINYNNLTYKVEYYFGEILDEEVSTVIGENSYGKVIDTYEDKVKPGYKLDKAQNLPLTITENEEENVIKVYYVPRTDLQYTVEHYTQNLDLNGYTLVETDKIENATFGEISTYEANEYEGFTFDDTLTVNKGAQVPANNDLVIKLFYTRNNYSYKVEHYTENLDGTWNKEKEVDEVNNVEYDSVTNYEANEYEGFTFEDKLTENKGALVPANNDLVIKLFYTRNNYSYKVEHYTENLDGTWNKEKEVDEVNNVEYESATSYESNEYKGFTFDDTLTKNKGAQVPANNDLVIKLFYTRNNYSYKVEHYTENLDGTWNKEKEVDEIKNVEYGSATSYEQNEYKGFTFDDNLTKNKGAQVPANNDLVIKLFYTRNNYNYKVEHYKQNTDKTWNNIPDDTVIIREDKNGNPIKYGAKAEYELMNYTGFENDAELTINGNTTVPANNNLVIKLYYTREKYTYKVEHYTEELEKDANGKIQWKLENTETSAPVEFGTDATYTKNTYTGFTFDDSRTVNKRVTVPNNNNLVIKLYYTRNIYNYRVEYYYNDNIDRNKTENGSAKYGSKITKYDDKPNGYIYSHVEPTNTNGKVELTITTVVTNNVIKVYYYSKPEIDIVKKGPSTANVGENIQYEIELTNKGKVPYKVTVTDTLQEGITFISATGNYEIKNRTIEWKDVLVTPNDSPVTLKVNVQIDKNMVGKEIINTAIIKDGESSTTKTNVNEITGKATEIIKGGIKKEPVNIVFVLDTSGTMSSNENNRLLIESAKDSMKEFVKTLYIDEKNTESTFTTVTFNMNAKIEQVNGKNTAEYTDYDEILETIGNITGDVGTDIYCALGTVISTLNNLKASEYGKNDNIVIFIGDGMPGWAHGAGNWEELNTVPYILQRANYIKSDMKTPIYTIGFGESAATKGEEAYSLLEGMASSPDKFSTAMNPTEIIEAFQKIEDKEKKITPSAENGVITIEVENELVVNADNLITVKYDGAILFTSSTKNNSSNYLTYAEATSSKNETLSFDINSWNADNTKTTKIVKDKIEIIYYSK